MIYFCLTQQIKYHQQFIQIKLNDEWEKGLCPRNLKTTIYIFF